MNDVCTLQRALFIGCLSLSLTLSFPLGPFVFLLYCRRCGINNNKKYVSPTFRWNGCVIWDKRMAIAAKNDDGNNCMRGNSLQVEIPLDVWVASCLFNQL